MNQINSSEAYRHDPVANPPGRGGTAWRYVALFVLLYVFLVAIKLLEEGISGFGEDFSAGLLEGVSNPFAGLSAGILFTVLVQSSSVTTSTIVALVGAGTLTVSSAVPMVMGANIGTTITASLVALGHLRRGAEFRRAFAAATMHDFFNILAVVVMFPVEMSTHFLARTAHKLTQGMHIGGGGSFKSPIKSAVKSGAQSVQEFFSETLHFSSGWVAGISLALGLALIFASLMLITKTMRTVIAHRAERALNRILQRSMIFSIALGAAVTMAVQSSSITTSLLVPMCGSGILTLESAFPVLLGANLGTTITAFLASLATDINGLEIALVHVMFNLVGVFAIVPVMRIRKIPQRLAEGLAVRATDNKIWVLVFVGLVFVVIPLLGILIF
ncbi:MAG: sodium dependent phosphate transporter [Planctomycetes bacterium]|nr:sodium dependent phosphate transporter [Planctomycetota bacterium]